MKFIDFLNEGKVEDVVKLISIPKTKNGGYFTFEYNGKKFEVSFIDNEYGDISKVSKICNKVNYRNLDVKMTNAGHFIQDSDAKKLSAKNLLKGTKLTGVVDQNGKVSIYRDSTLLSLHKERSESLKNKEFDASIKSHEKEALEELKEILLKNLNDAVKKSSSSTSEYVDDVYNTKGNIKGGIEIQYQIDSVETAYTVENSMQESDMYEGTIMLMAYEDPKDVNNKRKHFEIHGVDIVKFNGKKYSVYEDEFNEKFAE